jgi:replication-associated recombination protein RarA
MRLAEFRENLTQEGIRQAVADLTNAYPRALDKGLNNVYFADLSRVPAEVANTFRNLAKETGNDRTGGGSTGELAQGAG